MNLTWKRKCACGSRLEVTLRPYERAVGFWLWHYERPSVRFSVFGSSVSEYGPPQELLCEHYVYLRQELMGAEKTFEALTRSLLSCAAELRRRRNASRNPR